MSQQCDRRQRVTFSFARDDTSASQTAAEITGARYAALGVIDKTGQALERFLTTGVDAETHAAIGDLPHGRGILGVLIRDAQPLRLHDLADDPRSVGFPPLYISVRTAETHRAHVMQKLQLGSRAELVRYALAEGLLAPPDDGGA